MVKFADIRNARPPLVCRLASWTPWPIENAHLIGHCSIAFSGGWLAHQVPVFRRSDGTVSVGTADKKQCHPVITFERAASRDRRNRAVPAAALVDAGTASGVGGEDAP